MPVAKTHRKIQQWDRWLEHFPGASVLATEQKFLPHVLAQYYGKHALLLGTPRQYSLLKASAVNHQFLLSPLLESNHYTIRGIESEFSDLPVASGSIDLVILPHTLEFLDNPRQLLAEACRIVKPEGHIIICGFNPFSLWGLKKLFLRSKQIPWSGNFTSAVTIKKWLSYADFELVKHTNLLYRPPLNNQNIYKKLSFLEWLGNKMRIPFGGLYIVVAKAKVVPLTPIRLRWQQQVSGIRIPVMGMPKPTTRNPHR